jgi:hypothetical protein
MLDAGYAGPSIIPTWAWRFSAGLAARDSRERFSHEADVITLRGLADTRTGDEQK